MSHHNEDAFFMEEDGAAPTGLVIHDTFTGSQVNDMTGRSPDTVDNGQVWTPGSWGVDDIGIDGLGAAKWYTVSSTLASIGIETLGVEEVFAEGIYQQSAVSAAADAFLVVRSKLSDFLTYGVWAFYENDTSTFLLSDRGAGGGAFLIDSTPINISENVPFTIELTVTGATASATITQGGLTDTISGACSAASGNSAAGMVLRGTGIIHSKCLDFKITGL